MLMKGYIWLRYVLVQAPLFEPRRSLFKSLNSAAKRLEAVLEGLHSLILQLLLKTSGLPSCGLTLLLQGQDFDLRRTHAGDDILHFRVGVRERRLQLDDLSAQHVDLDVVLNGLLRHGARRSREHG